MSRTPQNLEAEQATLGSLLIEPACLSEVRDWLHMGDFYWEAHQWIYAAILALTDRNEAVDLITMQAEMQSLPAPAAYGYDNQFDAAGGTNYLMTVVEAPTTTANITYYANLVAETGQKRQALERLVEAHRIIRNDPEGVKTVVESGDYNLAKILAPRRADDNLPKLYSLDEFLSNLGPRPPFLITKIFPDHSFLLLAGKPKAGKSFLAIDIALSVAQGKDVVGAFRVNRPGPVVYLAMEDSKWTWGYRVQRHGIPDNSGLPLYPCFTRFHLNTEQSIAILKRMVAPINPVLLIVDNAKQALGITDWANMAEIESCMAPLRDFSREVCSVLLIAHNRKAEGQGGDEIAGSNAFTGAVDGWLSAQSYDALPGVFDPTWGDFTGIRVNYESKGRDQDLLNFTIDMQPDYSFLAQHPDDLRQEEQAEKQSKADQKQREACNAVFDTLVAIAPATVKDLAARLGKTDRAIKDGLAILIAEKRVVEAGKVKAEGSRGRYAQQYDIAPNVAEQPQLTVIAGGTLDTFFNHQGSTTIQAEEEIDPFADDDQEEEDES